MNFEGEASVVFHLYILSNTIFSVFNGIQTDCILCSFDK